MSAYLPPGVMEAIVKQVSEQMIRDMHHRNGNGRFKMTFDRAMNILSAAGMVLLLAFNAGGDWSKAKDASTAVPAIQADLKSLDKRVTDDHAVVEEVKKKVDDVRREQEEQKSLLIRILGSLQRDTR